ncbi:MAG: aldose 1-epimerase [Acidimicrobiia bacterium]|nr:aldose 1-epimerase [Acidimicrobiia bacterium]
MTSRSVVQANSHASVSIDLDQGCRLASLVVDGNELLVTEGSGPIDWGCYPMAPYAGRVRDGRFSFEGSDFELPRTVGRHAIHGTVYLQPWEQEGPSSFVAELNDPWPFTGFVRQDVRLEEDAIRLRLEVHALERPMPASCGWHPWFRRTVAGAPLRLEFEPGFALERDADGITTRAQAPVPSEPWDECFGGVGRPPVVEWPGVVRLEIASDCPWWVAYTEPPHAVCIEPQTHPPDALNHVPFVVEPGSPLVAATTISWRRG